MKLSLEGKIRVMNVADTLDNTVQDINPDLNPNMYTAVIILIVMSVSTVTTERSHELSALYSDNCGHVRTGLAHPQGRSV